VGVVIAAARDFFDYWIEHEVAEVDLASLGAKMQLARSLAETVSRVHDPLMRGEVASKVSARLGVPVQDFQTLFPKQPRSSGIRADESRPATSGTPPRHDVAMLCLLALRDETARDFLLQQNWQQVLAQVPDAEILVRILESDFRPNDAASLNAFMATLSAQDEGLVSSWLLQKVPPNAGTMVEKWWLGIRQGALRRQLDVAKNRIRLPQLSTGELVNLQKEILDLVKELRELPKLSSASRIDG
jgi:hypothetical protein